MEHWYCILSSKGLKKRRQKDYARKQCPPDTIKKLPYDFIAVMTLQKPMQSHHGEGDWTWYPTLRERASGNWERVSLLCMLPLVGKLSSSGRSDIHVQIAQVEICWKKKKRTQSWMGKSMEVYLEKVKECGEYNKLMKFSKKVKINLKKQQHPKPLNQNMY